jgi:hypothetical protein
MTPDARSIKWFRDLARLETADPALLLSIPYLSAVAEKEAEERRRNRVSNAVKRIISAICGAIVAPFLLLITLAIPVLVNLWYSGSSTDFLDIIRWVMLMGVPVGIWWGARAGYDPTFTNFGNPITLLLYAISEGKAAFIVIALLAGSIYWYTDVDYKKRIGNRLSISDAKVSASLDPANGQQSVISNIFTAPRNGIAYRVNYSQAVVGETSFLIRLYRRVRGNQYRLIQSCTTRSAERVDWWTGCNLPNVDLEAGSYAFWIGANTFGVTRTAKTDFVVQKYEKALIENIQRKLSELGFDAGPVDGVYGRRTRAAIESYQKRNRMPIDGEVSETLARALGIIR